ncbi:acyltransferase family protein [Mucilaginibacter glaciei]|uniref:Acyltransferase n=1 Tax=Mucilaginibacter glaciei TaxID=2772109 RepID=A0A926NS95_9SPHI|nr:acyltransferase [Mucilaginibacter glaciei]MBD1393785.1 acyltransferase [Mucilaginibacter glaciei]
MTINLNDALGRSNNNFDLVRLVAALLVIFGHSFYLFPTNGYPEPVKYVLGTDYSGSLAVAIFFFLSGIFITGSYCSSKTLFRFGLMRVFRIWPALIICMLVSVLVVGPLFTTLPLTGYFKSEQSWRYLVKNIGLMKLELMLPSVFKTNLYNTVLNGSLWTLPTEIKCYVFVLIAGLSRLIKFKWILLVMLLLAFRFRYNVCLVQFFGSWEGVQQFLFFVAGMAAYLFRQHILINTKAALFIILVCIAAWFFSQRVFYKLFYLTFLYSILAFGISGPAKRIKLPGDYSYGIYIYGFLVQQIVAHLMPSLTSYLSLLITIPFTVALGLLSWHLVEQPALKAVKRYLVTH